MRSFNETDLDVKLCEHDAVGSVCRVERNGGFEFRLGAAAHTLFVRKCLAVVRAITRQSGREARGLA